MSNSVLDSRVGLILGRRGDLATAITEALAGLGCTLVLGAPNGAACEELAARLGSDFGVEAMATSVNVTSEDEVGDLVATVRQRFGRLDVIVNHAAVFWSAAAEDVPIRCRGPEWNSPCASAREDGAGADAGGAVDVGKADLGVVRDLAVAGAAPQLFDHLHHLT